MLLPASLHTMALPCPPPEMKMEFSVTLWGRAQDLISSLELGFQHKALRAVFRDPQGPYEVGPGDRKSKPVLL